MKNTILSALVGALIVALIAAVQQPTEFRAEAATPDTIGCRVHPSHLRSYYVRLTPAAGRVVLDPGIQASNGFVITSIVTALGGGELEVAEDGVLKMTRGRQ